MSLKRFEKSSTLLFPIIIDNMIKNSGINVINETKKSEEKNKNYNLKLQELNDKENHTKLILDNLVKIVDEMQTKLIDIQNTTKIENIEFDKMVKEHHHNTITMNKINTDHENNAIVVKGLIDKLNKYIIEHEDNKNIVKGLKDNFEKNITNYEIKNNEIMQINKNINKMEENISILSPNMLYSGIIVAFNGSIIPTGWNICDGTNNTPDLRGRFILSSGSGNDLTIRTINDIGGSENHLLSVDELPGHLHNGITSSNGAHIHSINGNSINIGLINNDNNTNIVTCINETMNTKSLEGIISNSNGLHTHTFTTSITGGNKQHNNMPPFYVLAYIMKI